MPKLIALNHHNIFFFGIADLTKIVMSSMFIKKGLGLPAESSLELPHKAEHFRPNLAV